MNYTGLKLIALDTWTDPYKYSIYEFTCIKDNGTDTITIAERKEPIYKAFCYPDGPETRAFLQKQIDHKAKMVALEDEHQTQMYKDLNELTRTGKR